MRYIKIAGSCLNQTALAFDQNTEHIIRAIEEAKRQKIEVLCLPELTISGYGCEDAFFSQYALDRSLEALERIQAVCEGILVTVGLPMSFEHCLYNVVCVIYDKEICGFVAKQELPGDGIYYEPRWFKCWKEGVVVDYEWKGRKYPFGDTLFQLDGIRIGLEICEDAWNGVRPAQRHYLNNVDLILNPSASNFAMGKTITRERLVTETSRSYTCTYVYSNLVGNEAGRIIYDGEILIAQGGNLLARNKRFTFEDFQLLSVTVDLESIRLRKKKSFNFEPSYPPHLVHIEGSWDATQPEPLAPVELVYESWEEEFYLAETLALFDYMRKSRSRGFVLSLSGGADSSTCAVLCAKALERAREELGEERFGRKLGYIDQKEGESLSHKLLTYVYQGTENSSEDTLESARELAKGVGATFYNWDMSAIHKAYIGVIEGSLGRELTWEQDDIALQNIQARLRSPSIWMLTNIRGALLISTSNRSEAAVGYATMDGDTSGGIAPLAGIDKASLLAWLHWAETHLGIPELRYVNSLTPTAELRPDTYDQTDEDDLMPYPILEAIEERAIGEYKSPLEVFISLRGICEDLKLKGYIRKFFLLWSRNQWKRERYAPSFHLDDKNLDPKTWCRFPILNGGFWRALREMDAYV